ncbi:MAG: SDR family oxidoreductase, partial [Hymenobacteraceae bacterium]|nr:SDR family oxidoreductase [Hymenobacteraceae bacterium]
MTLNDKTILVVGASSGIGLTIAQALTKAGAEVITASRHVSDELKQLGTQNITLDVLQLDNELQEQLPNELHGLVYCPGSIRLKPFERLPLEDFRKD